MTTADRPLHLRLMETFHNLFYTPIYVAVGGGFLDQQQEQIRPTRFISAGLLWLIRQVEELLIPLITPILIYQLMIS